jgi:hypothetical protein
MSIGKSRVADVALDPTAASQSQNCRQSRFAILFIDSLAAIYIYISSRDQNQKHRFFFEGTIRKPDVNALCCKIHV